MNELTGLTNKIVLLRADLNLPYDNGVFGDLTRLKRLIPTLTWLLEKGARILVVSHLGRPKGRDLSLSLAPLAPLMAQYAHVPVHFVPDCIGPAVKDALQGPGQLFLLENVRFHPEEEAGDATFAQALAEAADFFINDAFSVSHRAHASVVGVTQFLPAYPGLQMKAELAALEGALTHPQRPVVAIVGGSKVSTKIDLLMNLVTKVDTLIMGGGMANTFLKAQGIDVGASLAEDCPDLVRAIQEKALAAHCRILLPCDGVGAQELKGQQPQILSWSCEEGVSFPPQNKIFDVGPQSLASFSAALASAKTVIWNGPLGVFEVPPYDQGTTTLAHRVARLTQDNQLVSVAGGGDTVAALTHAGVAQDMTDLSTAGGAFLEWMEGKILPGVAALKMRPHTP